MLAWIEKLARLAPPVFVMGGLAEDVLLGLGPNQPHHDLDLLVPAAEMDGALAQLRALGMSDFQPVLTDAGGRPRLVHGRADGLEVELYAAAPEPDGGFSFEVPAQGPAGRLRLFAPPDTFAYPASQAAGLTLQTVSPWALALMRAASAQTRHAGNAKKQAADLARLAELRQQFLAQLSEAQLEPRIAATNG